MPGSLKYYSTNHVSPSVRFREALLKGQAPDKGLYMPEFIPEVTPEEVRAFSGMDYTEIAFLIGRKYLEKEIPDTDLAFIVKEAYNYPVPLEKVTGRKHILRLDRGPTASFKDFAARMMGRLMQFYLGQEGKELLILTATSGDTGSAVANAFYGLDHIKCVVLFPENEVTARQRKQMTTLGKNICILALDGKFDDCQALVKQAFADPDLAYLPLSSANSINIGRLIPQSIYYFYAFSKLMENRGEKAVFSVPSGNFGDMMGGMLALRMGLPARKFVIATNENDEFPKYLHTGIYNKIVPSRNCISSAMNVGHPSNLARLVALYGGVMDETGRITRQADLEQMRSELYGVSISDRLTRETISAAYSRYGCLLEPHGAVGWAGLTDYLQKNPEEDRDDRLCISLETAHPAKFPEEISAILGLDPALPPSLEGIGDKEEHFERIATDYDTFRAFLKENY